MKCADGIGVPRRQFVDAVEVVAFFRIQGAHFRVELGYQGRKRVAAQVTGLD